MSDYGIRSPGSNAARHDDCHELLKLELAISLKDNVPSSLDLKIRVVISHEEREILSS